MRKLFSTCLVIFALIIVADAADLPKVVVVTTGGTIAEKVDPKTGAAVPAVSGKDLIGAVPALKKLARVDVVSVCNIDSSHMTPAIWLTLSKKVDSILADKDVTGVVVTHGTDTMAEGSFFLALTLKSNKPVVFTGAMRNASEPGPDGPANIYNAVLQAVLPVAKDWGVTVSLNNYINSAICVRKTSSFNPQTFESGLNGYLGYVCDGKVTKVNVVPKLPKHPLPADGKLPKVSLFYAYSGDDGEAVRHAITSGAKGIVVAGVGAGNINPQVADAVIEAIKKNVEVVICTDVETGPVAPVYGVKGAAAYMQDKGAVLSGNVPPRKARLLLMLALAANKNHAAIRKLFAASTEQ